MSLGTILVIILIIICWAALGPASEAMATASGPPALGLNRGDFWFVLLILLLLGKILSPLKSLKKLN